MESAVFPATGLHVNFLSLDLVACLRNDHMISRVIRIDNANYSNLGEADRSPK